MLDNILSLLPIILAVVVVLAIILTGYVKAPPDQAYIISGLKKESKVLIGRAGIRVPFFERMDRLYLGQMTVDIKTEQSVPTSDFINVNVDAVAKVRISPHAEGIKLAAKNFLNKRPEEITRDLQDSLQGNMREIIGTLSLKEINTDRDSFSDQVMQKASKDMDKLGIEILSCNIQNVTDENGLIKDLGADNTSLIKKNAAIAKAQADRDIAIAQAERKSDEAQKFAKEQEAEGIAAVGKAEAESIRAKALAEAEGIDKKAEAMKKYGEAAVIEMVMQALPEIARNVAEPLSKVDKITMYGSGNSAKLLEDIVTGTTQVTEGITQGMGLDVKSLIAGMLGGRLAGGEDKTIIVQNPPAAEKPHTPPAEEA